MLNNNIMLITFLNIDCVPDDFEGCCYLSDYKAKYWLKPARVFHRENAPAIEYDVGAKIWYNNDVRERLDGPAFDWGDNNKEFFIEGKIITEQDYWNHPKIILYKLNHILQEEDQNI